MRDHLTPLERAVTDALLAGDHPVLEALRQQLARARVRERRKTGVGFFTYFEVGLGAPAAPTSQPHLHIGDVGARLEGLRHGAGFVLFVENGRLHFLEGFSYDEPWPEQEEIVDVRYNGGVRDLQALDL